MALPPEKTDGLASGDEKRMEKSSESCPGSKKQLKFEVSLLSWHWAEREGFFFSVVLLMEEAEACPHGRASHLLHGQQRDGPDSSLPWKPKWVCFWNGAN